MIEYRKANISDVERLSQLRVTMLNEDSTYSESYNLNIKNNTTHFIKNGLAENSVVVWVALKDSIIIAMVCANFFELPPNDWCPNARTAYIGNMYTIPDFRQKGIATRLLQLIIDEAKNKKCERVLLNTNDAGRSLYEGCGFEFSPTAMSLFPVGIIPT